MTSPRPANRGRRQFRSRGPSRPGQPGGTARNGRMLAAPAPSKGDGHVGRNHRRQPKAVVVVPVCRMIVVAVRGACIDIIVVPRAAAQHAATIAEAPPAEAGAPYRMDTPLMGIGPRYARAHRGGPARRRAPLTRHSVFSVSDGDGGRTAAANRKPPPLSRPSDDRRGGSGARIDNNAYHAPPRNTRRTSSPARGSSGHHRPCTDTRRRQLVRTASPEQARRPLIDVARQVGHPSGVSPSTTRPPGVGPPDPRLGRGFPSRGRTRSRRRRARLLAPAPPPPTPLPSEAKHLPACAVSQIVYSTPRTSNAHHRLRGMFHVASRQKAGSRSFPSGYTPSGAPRTPPPSSPGASSSARRSPRSGSRLPAPLHSLRVLPEPPHQCGRSHRPFGRPFPALPTPLRSPCPTTSRLRTSRVHEEYPLRVRHGKRPIRNASTATSWRGMWS